MQCEEVERDKEAWRRVGKDRGGEVMGSRSDGKEQAVSHLHPPSFTIILLCLRTGEQRRYVTSENILGRDTDICSFLGP